MKGKGQSLRKAEAIIPKCAGFPILGTWRKSSKQQEEMNRAEKKYTTSRDASAQNQLIDLVNVYVGIREGSVSCGTS